MSVGPFHSGVLSLIAHLWNRGIPVVAWCEVEEGIILLCCWGWEITVERRALGGRTDVLAQAIAEQWPYRKPNVLDTPARAEDVPQVAPRTLYWWRFLRWLLERERQVVAAA